MPKAKPLNGELKAAVPAVLATVKTNSKPGFWTREKLAEKLAEKFGKRTVVSAIVYLRTGANRKLDKKRGGYLLAKASAEQKSISVPGAGVTAPGATAPR